MDLDSIIKQQHRHFGISYDDAPRSLDPAEENFRIACMLEEISEFVLASDIEAKYDALLDLIVFAAGTCERMGLPITPGLTEVVRANLQKRLGPNNKRGSFSIDLQKPDGWTAPNLQGILDDINHS